MGVQDVSESRVLMDRYALGAQLGQGGMGTVREAIDQRLGRRVAVKILRPDLAVQPIARRRFESEARAAARLAHPNVVMVFDSGEDDGIPFLVMERLPGRTLADDLAEAPLSLERFHRVAAEILSALGAAHAAGIIHRDVKPGNVLLTDDDHVKVSDFGIAKTIDDIDQTLTIELIASPGYLAPERLSGEPATPRSDLYSVGVLLYEALAGRRPFQGTAQVAVMRAIETGDSPALSSVRPGLPTGVVSAIERAMSVDPRRRFASASDMAAALESAAELDATVPIDTSSGTETVAVAAREGRTEAMQHPGAAGPRRPARVGRRVAVALALGVVAAAALTVDVVANHGDSRHPAVPARSTPATTVTLPTTTTPTNTAPPPVTPPPKAKGKSGPGKTPGSGKGHKGPSRP